MAVNDYDVLPFAGPTGLPVRPEQVRGNDETLRAPFVAHQADDVAHVQSGDVADRPASASEGAVWISLDTLTISIYDGAAWADLASTVGPSGGSTDHAIARWDGASGHLLLDSVAILTDAGALSGLISLAIAGGSTTNALLVTTTGAIIASLRRDASTRIDFKTVTTGLATIDSVGSAPNFAWAINGVEYFNVGSNAVTFGNSTSVTLVSMASNASRAGLRLPHGSAPTAPVNGDVWTTTAGVFAQMNGVTRELQLVPLDEDFLVTEDN